MPHFIQDELGRLFHIHHIFGLVKVVELRAASLALAVVAERQPERILFRPDRGHVVVDQGRECRWTNGCKEVCGLSDHAHDLDWALLFSSPRSKPRKIATGTLCNSGGVSAGMVSVVSAALGATETDGTAC